MAPENDKGFRMAPEQTKTGLAPSAALGQLTWGFMVSQALYATHARSEAQRWRTAVSMLVPISSNPCCTVRMPIS
jgi:hypothetical protein